MRKNGTSGVLIALVFALLSLGFAIYATVDRLAFVRNSTLTTGQVIRTEQRTSGKTDRNLIYVTKHYEVSVIAYRDAAGKPHRIEESPFLSEAPLPVGAKTSVRYDKNHPDDAIVDSAVNLYGYIIMLYAMAGVFFLVFLYALKSSRSKAGQ
ncbi:DUF3592 domain-containing protein [Propionivibrio dicarboxylicus]|uniref:DUF3592 domain-containing protein n=1 Tax=Propionivibrio dicarboxylicus TaxID=83767 RepID=A0A1G8FV72_9RHOO|nr:DUF3592 domain-containing protein [Propionivibrio dicarboxylicus]SDH86038.1 Protein of unknown function [Propionivibrio dicarboxylicus]